MNEIGEEENLSLLSEDTVKLAEYIESVIPDAINLIAQDENVSIALLNTGNMTSGGTSSEGCTVIPLPQDFYVLCLCVFRDGKERFREFLHLEVKTIRFNTMPLPEVV